MINEDLRKFRQLHDLTQAQAANVFGLTQGAWSHYESKRKNIKLKTYLNLKNIAESKGLIGFPSPEAFV
ncbi:helix-turn-helix transcriptional regulator [uncultured Endozoicomonas sp.]|uniref:helix-turn-helix domain-containing protein n=1 Tax=uncultured Endozoicomonas sp. TaxID=432652 RepID=UPI002615A903|nr:helix-turn-helix transcriptional regulator [uncultured Endozoicomonas sp.]